MGEYLYPLIVISALVGMVSLAAYPSSSNRTLKFACAILLIYTALTPAFAIVKDVLTGDPEDFFDGIKDDLPECDGEYIDVAQNAFKEGICKLIITNYGIKRENIDIFVFEFDFEKMRAEKIKIVLTGRAAAADFRGMEEYLDGLGLGDFDVNIEL